MRRTAKRLVITAAILAAVVLVGTWTRNQLGIELDVESVRDFATGLGPAGPILFVFIVAGRSLLALPSQVVLIAVGLCFGTAVGTVVGGLGLMGSGLALFLLARFAGRESIEKRLGPRGRGLFAFASQRTGAATFAIACGYPLSPLSPLHAGAGLTPMPIYNFVLAAFVGGSIRASIFAYLGSALIEASWTQAIVPAGLFIFAAIIPLAFPTGRSWLREIFTPPQSD